MAALRWLLVSAWLVVQVGCYNAQGSGELEDMAGMAADPPASSRDGGRVGPVDAGDARQLDAGPPDAGRFTGEPCFRGDVAPCVCDDGQPGEKQCMFEPRSPTMGVFSVCNSCAPVTQECDPTLSMPSSGDIDFEPCPALQNATSACVVLPTGGPRCIVIECDEGFADCDGEKANGCECSLDDAGVEG